MIVTAFSGESVGMTFLWYWLLTLGKGYFGLSGTSENWNAFGGSTDVDTFTGISIKHAPPVVISVM